MNDYRKAIKQVLTFSNEMGGQLLTLASERLNAPDQKELTDVFLDMISKKEVVPIKEGGETYWSLA